jgi:hypothetical protein
LIQRGDYRNKGLNPAKLSWVQVPFPVKMVSVTRKLSMIQEHSPDQRCLFQQGNYRNKGHNPENLSCVQDPVKMASVASVTVHQSIHPSTYLRIKHAHAHTFSSLVRIARRTKLRTTTVRKRITNGKRPI